MAHHWTRITTDPAVMGGKPCIRGMRVTVGAILGLLAAGQSREDILAAYPYLEPEDIQETLAYAVWRLQEQEYPLTRDERARRTRRLAASEDDVFHEDVEEAWRLEIAARVAALDAGTAEIVPADEVFRRLREKLTKLRRG